METPSIYNAIQLNFKCSKQTKVDMVKNEMEVSVILTTFKILLLEHRCVQRLYAEWKKNMILTLFAEESVVSETKYVKRFFTLSLFHGNT